MTGICVVNQLIHLDCGNDELKKRLMERKRIDDTEEIIDTRIRNHLKESIPVLEYFNDKKLVTNINGQQSREEVYQSLRQKLLPYLEKNKVKEQPQSSLWGLRIV